MLLRGLGLKKFGKNFNSVWSEEKSVFVAFWDACVDEAADNRLKTALGPYPFWTAWLAIWCMASGACVAGLGYCASFSATAFDKCR